MANSTTWVGLTGVNGEVNCPHNPALALGQLKERIISCGREFPRFTSTKKHLSLRGGGKVQSVDKLSASTQEGQELMKQKDTNGMKQLEHARAGNRRMRAERSCTNLPRGDELPGS